MIYEDFEFCVENLCYTNIEEYICSKLNVGNCNSSNFKLKLEPEQSYNSHLYADYGNISCRIFITKSQSNDKFTIQVSAISVQKHRKRRGM